MVLIKGKKMADLQGFDGGRSPNEPSRSDGNLLKESNPVFAWQKRTAKRKKICWKILFAVQIFAFCKDYEHGLDKRQKNGRPTRIRTSTK